MNGFLEPELAEFEWSMEHWIDKQCQKHDKLNSVTFLYIKNIYMYICDHMLQQVLEMSSSNYQTCLILKEIKHWGTLFWITYNFHMISFHNKGPLYWNVLHTHEGVIHYTVLDMSVINSRPNLDWWLRRTVLYACQQTGNL